MSSYEYAYIYGILYYNQLQNLARGPRPAEHINFAVSQRVFNHILIPSGGDTRHHNDSRHDGVKVQKKF